jgi:hypothetical protein
MSFKTISIILYFSLIVANREISAKVNANYSSVSGFTEKAAGAYQLGYGPDFLVTLDQLSVMDSRITILQTNFNIAF